MKQFPPVFALILSAAFLPGCATTSQAVTAEEAVLEEEYTLPFPDAVPQGCAVAEALKSLVAPKNSAEIKQSLLNSVLAIPPEHICWIEKETDCDEGSCVQVSTIAALIRLYEGPYGIRNAVHDNADAKAAFMRQLARGLDAIATAEEKPTVSELINGMPFELFRDSHTRDDRPDIDGGALEYLLDDLAHPLKLWVLRNAIPETLARAERTLKDLSYTKETEQERAERDPAFRDQKEKDRAEALRKREHDRLRADLQRRLLELQEAAERARRAAEVVRAARVQSALPVVRKRTAVKTTSQTPYEAQCRKGATSRTVGESPLRATAADIYCLVTEAKANPDVVPPEEVKRLAALFISLQETAVSIELEDLRWPLAAPADAQTLLKDLGEVPIVSTAWKKRMKSKVTRVCTDHLENLAKSEHEDIILADQWINACFAENLGKRRKWHRKIASKLKHAITWRDRLAAERAAKEAKQRSVSPVPEPPVADPAPEAPPTSE